MINYGEKNPEETRELVPVVYDLEQAKANLVVYADGIDKMLARIEEIRVDSPETNFEANTIGATAAGALNRLKTAREGIIADADGFVKGVNTFCHQFSEKLKEIKEIASKKTGQYTLFIEQERQKREMRAREEAEYLRVRLEREAEEDRKKRQEEAQKKAEEEAKVKGEDPTKIVVAEVEKIEVPTVVAPIIPKKQTITRTEAGTGSLTQKWTFEVLEKEIGEILLGELKVHILSPQAIEIFDRLSLVVSHMVFSDTKLRESLKSGITVPGVRFFQEAKSRYRGV